MKIISLAAFAFALATNSSVAIERTLEVNKTQSTVEIVVKATVDSFTGRLAEYQPKLVIDPATGKVLQASVGFNFVDVKTGKADRDKQMLAWAEAETHPQGVFTMTDLQPDAVNGRHLVKGTLKFHGVEKSVEFPLSITTDQKIYSFDGEARVDTREFGLPIIRKFGLLKVDPIVKIRFHLQANAAAL